MWSLVTVFSHHNVFKVHVVARVGTCFIFMAKYYFIVWMYHILCIHLFLQLFNGHLGRLYVLALLTNAAVSICV